MPTERKRRDRRKTNGEYDVGYGKPPKEHHFQAGRSGNPAGGRKKARTGVEIDVDVQGGLGPGLPRLSLPFLAGTFFTGDRRRAVTASRSTLSVAGCSRSSISCCSHAFSTPGRSARSSDSCAGCSCSRPAWLLPYIHPRMASEYDGATATRQLEPPGLMGLN